MGLGGHLRERPHRAVWHSIPWSGGHERDRVPRRRVEVPRGGSGWSGILGRLLRLLRRHLLLRRRGRGLRCGPLRLLFRRPGCFFRANRLRRRGRGRCRPMFRGRLRSRRARRRAGWRGLLPGGRRRPRNRPGGGLFGYCRRDSGHGSAGRPGARRPARRRPADRSPGLGRLRRPGRLLRPLRLCPGLLRCPLHRLPRARILAYLPRAPLERARHRGGGRFRGGYWGAGRSRLLRRLGDHGPDGQPVWRKRRPGPALGPLDLHPGDRARRVAGDITPPGRLPGRRLRLPLHRLLPRRPGGRDKGILFLLFLAPSESALLFFLSHALSALGRTYDVPGCEIHDSRPGPKGAPCPIPIYSRRAGGFPYDERAVENRGTVFFMERGLTPCYRFRSERSARPRPCAPGPGDSASRRTFLRLQVGRHPGGVVDVAGVVLDHPDVVLEVEHGVVVYHLPLRWEHHLEQLPVGVARA